MGIVYAAHDERLGRRVALKQLLPESAHDAHRRERFRREARAIARLDHPGVVQIYDLLETPDGDWIVMQYVAGPTLAKRLRQGPMPPEHVVTLGREVTAALEAAHAQGLLHRDLKAENVVLTATGAKVLDFGLAKLYQQLGNTTATSSLTHGIAGTYRSMSPEQANGFELDPRSDLFSLGVLLYEAATTVSPFRADTPVASMTRVCSHLQVPAREIEAAVPADLSGLIDALLEKEPAQRPDSATAVLQRLETCSQADVPSPAASRSTHPRAGFDPDSTVLPLPAADSPSATSPSATSPSATSPRNSSPRNIPRHTLRRLGVATALLVLVAAFLVLRLAAPDPESLYVLVDAPRLGTSLAPSPADTAESPDRTDGDDVTLARAALHAALLRSLASLRGVVAVPPSDSEAATIPALAALYAADEVLTSSLDCGAQRCLATLRRQRGADGKVLGVETFEAPVDDPRLLSIATETYLKAAYRGFAPRAEHEWNVAPEDYVHFLRLKRHWETRRPTHLEPLFEELATIRAGSPSFVDSYLLEARMLYRRFYETRGGADLQRALDLLTRARSLDPADPAPAEILFNLALDAGRLNVAATAAADLEALIPGDVGTLCRQAELAAARGESERALELMAQAVERRPAAHLLLDFANMELHLGRVDAARATLERLLQRFPGHLRGEKLLAQVELQSGSAERAVQLYRHLLERRRGFAELSNLGIAYLLLGDWPQAAESLGEAHALAPNSAQATLNLADALSLAGRLDQATALYQRVLERVAEDPAPGHWQTLSIKAQALAHLGRGAEAAAAIQQATTVATNDPQLAYEAALVYTLLGEPASALASAERAVAGGFDQRWFGLPFFRPLLDTPGWRDITAPEATP